MGFKDSIGVEGFKNQNGTTAFAGNVCVQDNPAVARVRAARVVILGITIASAFSGSTSGNFAANAWNGSTSTVKRSVSLAAAPVRSR
jgi:Asp-tRNA(Asn)/Glu-tRNA(Gln) amidotransferase A subunit family amidase